jgi:hypothetical protein
VGAVATWRSLLRGFLGHDGAVLAGVLDALDLATVLVDVRACGGWQDDASAQRSSQVPVWQPLFTASGMA